MPLVHHAPHHVGGEPRSLLVGEEGDGQGAATANAGVVQRVDDLETGEQELVHESSGSFVIGDSAYDPDSEMLYVPDAAENEVLELAADGCGFVELGSSTIAPGVGLPPTKVYLLD